MSTYETSSLRWGVKINCYKIVANPKWIAIQRTYKFDPLS